MSSTRDQRAYFKLHVPFRKHDRETFVHGADAFIGEPEDDRAACGTWSSTRPNRAIGLSRRLPATATRCNSSSESYADMRFSENVLLQLHQMLYRYQPGSGERWKSTDNQIVERDAAGHLVRVRFTFEELCELVLCPPLVSFLPHGIDQFPTRQPTHVAPFLAKDRVLGLVRASKG